MVAQLVLVPFLTPPVCFQLSLLTDPAVPLRFAAEGADGTGDDGGEINSQQLLPLTYTAAFILKLLTLDLQNAS